MGDHQLHVPALFAARPGHRRASSRVRWEQTARPVFDESTGRWEVRVDPWREFQRPLLSNGDLVDVVHSVDPHL